MSYLPASVGALLMGLLTSTTILYFSTTPTGAHYVNRLTGAERGVRKMARYPAFAMGTPSRPHANYLSPEEALIFFGRQSSTFRLPTNKLRQHSQEGTGK
jgi:hypothetical protein